MRRPALPPPPQGSPRTLLLALVVCLSHVAAKSPVLAEALIMKHAVLGPLTAFIMGANTPPDLKSASLNACAQVRGRAGGGGRLSAAATRVPLHLGCTACACACPAGPRAAVQPGSRCCLPRALRSCAGTTRSS